MPDGDDGGTSALLVTGPVGAGKTTTVVAVGGLLRERGVPHAVVDLDWLSRAWPNPDHDPFGQDLELENLRHVARTFLAGGARRLLLAGVLEEPSARERYAAAVGVPLVVCRLRVPPDDLRARLHRRHADDPEGLAWHLHRAVELEAVLTAAAIGDAVVDVPVGAGEREVAAAVVDAVGWNRTARPGNAK